MKTKTMQTRGGLLMNVNVHVTANAARKSMSSAARKLCSAAVYELPGGGFDIFQFGHPVPKGAVRV